MSIALIMFHKLSKNPWHKTSIIRRQLEISSVAVDSGGATVKVIAETLHLKQPPQSSHSTEKSRIQTGVRLCHPEGVRIPYIQRQVTGTPCLSSQRPHCHELLTQKKGTELK